MPSWIPWLVLGAWVIWFIGVLAHGAGLSIWTSQPNFAQAGVFGDAFGSLGSLMATLAAAGALLTLRQQQAQSERKNFESNFFSLLDHFQSLSQSTQAHNWILNTAEDGSEFETVSHSFHGHQAFGAILDEMRSMIEADEFVDDFKIKAKYERFYEEFQDDLGHYFGLLYHLFKIISERCSGSEDDKYYYSQIVRAHLSTSELILLAYNCICGEGRHKFVGYLERFAVLLNVGFRSDFFGIAEKKFIQLMLPPAAFISRSQAKENELFAGSN